MSLTLEEIAIAFKKCNGDAKFSFKEHLHSLYKSKENYEKGFVISNINNYILTDIEKLLSKAILNICSTDYLLKKGYFSWGFVTSYYGNFFLIQALNRTQLNFTTWVNTSVECQFINYKAQDMNIKSIAKSTDEHQRQFQLFFNNFKDFKNRQGIDRYWNIGIQPFKLGSESEIRNKINYEISLEAFYELDLDEQEFKRIIEDNIYSPFIQDKEKSTITNYARQNLKLAIARLRMLTYILNIIAIRNIEYRSYYQRNMRNRLEAITNKYPDVSNWIAEHFKSWLIFDSGLVETGEI
ncbi:MAG: hypothetical protein VKL60_12155 [Sphaerospermopsis sp.]|nr:hypothetical protein [Sphaerospermopsis sp.]